MTFNNFIKMSPILGITGIGGGPIGLPLVGGSAGLPYFGGRGVFASGNDGNSGWTYANVIDYITISSTGNATDFGDLTEVKSELAACSSSTRALTGGGWTGSAVVNTIEYFTMASTGNGTDFGDLQAGAASQPGGSNKTRAVFQRGDTMEFVQIATLGNALDFGFTIGSDGSVTEMSNSAGTSNGHGGI